MSFNIVNLVMQYITPDMIGRVAHGLGLDRTLAQKAVIAMIPSILGGMAARAAKPEGARQLSDILGKQDPGLLGKLGGLIGGPQQASVATHGVEALGQILGGSALGGLAEAVSKYSGLGEPATKGLMGLLAPLAIGSVAQHQIANHLDAGGLASLLAGQKNIIAAAMPGDFAATQSASGWLDSITGIVNGTAAAAGVLDPARSVTDQAAGVLKGVIPAAVATGADAARQAAVAVGGTIKAAVPNAPVPVVDAVKSAAAHGATQHAGASPAVNAAKPAAPQVTTVAADAVTRHAAPYPAAPARPAAAPVPTARQTAERAAAPAAATPTAVSAHRQHHDVVHQDGGNIRGWLAMIPVLLSLLGAIWLLQGNAERHRIEADRLRIEAAEKVAAETKARLKAEADAAAAKLAAESEARRKAEAEAAAAAAKLAAEVEARRKAEADASAARLAAEAEARKKAELAAAGSSGDAEARAKAEAQAAVVKAAAEAEARRKADADAAAAKLAAEAQARQQADAAKAAAEAEAKRRSEAEAARLAAEAKAKSDVVACQTAVTAAAATGRILFETASASLAEASAPTLKRLADAIKACPSTRIRIEGHTDSDGDINRNQRLSENRAKSVTDYLVNAGVDANRLTSIGLGQTKPVVPNDSDANKLRNRRIEFVVGQF